MVTYTQYARLAEDRFDLPTLKHHRKVLSAVSYTLARIPYASFPVFLCDLLKVITPTYYFWVLSYKGPFCSVTFLCPLTLASHIYTAPLLSLDMMTCRTSVRPSEDLQAEEFLQTMFHQWKILESCLIQHLTIADPRLMNRTNPPKFSNCNLDWQKSEKSSLHHHDHNIIIIITALITIPVSVSLLSNANLVVIWLIKRLLLR